MEFDFDWQSDPSYPWDDPHFSCYVMVDGTCVACRLEVSAAELAEGRERIEDELEAEGLAYIEVEGLGASCPESGLE